MKARQRSTCFATSIILTGGSRSTLFRSSVLSRSPIDHLRHSHSVIIHSNDNEYFKRPENNRRHCYHHSFPSRERTRMDLSNTGIYDPGVSPSNIRVVVFGSTGYIGRYVVFELTRQGYNVTAYARERSGVGGRSGRKDVLKDFGGKVRVVFGNLEDEVKVKEALVGKEDKDRTVRSTVVVSCLASRSGGIKDSKKVDYELTKSVLDIAVQNGVQHFVLLSAICVQRPLLAFQREKLRLEAELQRIAALKPEFSYSIVRPTAFFKSLGAQVERVKDGKAFIMFGNGDLSKCNALSEADLARFITECLRDVEKRNKILPIGGPGKPVTPKEQAEMLFRIVGKKEKYLSLPIGIMDVAIGLLDAVGKIVPAAREAAEFGRIGKYYATEDMVGPNYGADTLQAFFENVVLKGMEGQELGDAAIF